MDQKLLVFAGKKQSGKSSAANFVTGYILTQMGRRHFPHCPTNFTIDEEGQLIVNTVVADTNDNSIDSDGILNLNRKDDNFLIWATDILWPYVKQYAFADALKFIAISIFNIEPNLVYGTDQDKNKPTHIKWKDMCGFLPPRTVSRIKKAEKYEKNMTGREFLQYFGTNICRELYDECWTTRCINDIITDGAELAIIQDCRFANEVKYCYKLKETYSNIDVKVIKLTKTDGYDVHESENGLAGIADTTYDLVINNDYMTIHEKNQTILDALYNWGWLSGHISLDKETK